MSDQQLITPGITSGITMDELPLAARTKVLALYAACKRIREAGAVYGGLGPAIRGAAVQCGISASSMRRYYDKWLAADFAPMSLADLRHRKMQSRSRTTSPEFMADWHARCIQCQRKGGVPTARILLIRDWMERRKTIAGYEDWPHHPAIPAGWGLRNLERLAPKSLETVALKQGILTAAPQLAQVLATRCGLWLGSHYMIDDVWLDVQVLDGRAYGRPLQLGVLEYLTGKRVTWGQKIRRVDEETGRKKQLNEQDMRCLLALWGATIGYSPRGTTLVVENGTASISEELETLLHDASGGLIKVDRSGIRGTQQTLKQGHAGRGLGNFKHKAPLESYHNLQHNRLSHLPAATGHDRTPPETSHGLERAQRQLLRQMDKMTPERAAQARPYMITMAELTHELTLAVTDINGRTDHAMEGWERCGFEIEEMRSAPSAPWTSSAQIAPAIAQAIIQQACQTGSELVRRRRMSPTEAWEHEASKPGCQLITLPPWCICQILGMSMARPIKVASAYITIQDRTIQDEELIYESRILTPAGVTRELPHGQYQGYANPYNADQLFICDLQGRCIGTARIVQRVSRGDEHGIERAMGKAAARADKQLEYARIIGAPAEAALVRQREHNSRLISGEPVTAEDYADAYALEADPAERRAVTKATTAARVRIPAVNLIPDAEEASDDTPHALPTVRFL